MNLKRILKDHSLWFEGKGGSMADLRVADLRGADLSGARLYRAGLSGANLSWANLSWANLYGADLSEADLYGANLSGADLSGADLSGADLREASLRGASLRGASLSRADFSGAKRGDCTLKSLIASIDRSDGYAFFLWNTEQGWRMDAGCRWFTFKEAEAHWKATRDGTPLGRETMDILRFFRARAKSFQ